ncbi:LacI family transcriptional regulator [Sphingobacterium sp. SGG-5]|uniref:LacI family DNA-binding transcriptional regulator n=1 Tax=Sphingobacterium sp. SGG-5 TaxID=2710881 RepID=UPI0013EB7AD2|nr:LacI family DNA-binding transcriptional regulator [Sphingobacterium sp. SGG-5]NGM60331.1 LacI family transcriptional regulator [Sphingobacterium sp. SGG-5]
MSKVTLKELARELNMSVSTVSKALNDSYEISEATKQRVKELASKYNYRPNALAKNLKLGRTNNIGVIISTIGSPFQAQIIEALHRASVRFDFNLIMMQSQDSEEIERKALNTLINHGVEGLLISPAFENSNIDLLSHLHKTTCPIVLFDRINYNIDTFKVGVNNEKSIYRAAEELFKIGRKKIAILCGKNIGVTKDRLKGYRKALEDYHIDFNPSYIIYCDYNNSLEGIDSDMETKLTQLLHSEQAPDAVLGTTDTLTTRVLGVLSKLNIQVPEDLAVIGFANTDIAESLNPSLSTIRQPTFEMADIAIEKLINLIESKNRSQIDVHEILLDSTIQLRKSTKQKLS